MNIKPDQENYQLWLWEKIGNQCVENLIKNGFDAHWVPTCQSAADTIWTLASNYQTFGFAGSDTTRKLGLPQKAIQMGKTVFDHWQNDLSADEDLAVRLEQGRCDCFICSANGISMTGEIVNVDGIGNRTSAMAFGPKKIIIAAGMNKVTKDLPSALERIRETAAPMRAKSLNMKTPCAQTGVCSDCQAPQRICRITTILHRKPLLSDISVVLINDSLGF